MLSWQPMIDSEFSQSSMGHTVWPFALSSEKLIPKYRTVFLHNSDFCVIVRPIPINNPIVTLNPTSEFMLVSGDIKA